MKLRTSLIRLLTLSALLFGLAACSGGGSGQSTDGSGTGTVGILLTDKPADPDLFLSINATIEAVSLIADDDDDNRGKVVVYDGPATTIDLLRLRNESIPLTYNDRVPAGEYCKIRLTLSDLELVLADDTPNDATDNKTYHPHLPGNGKLDLKVRGCLDVVAGEVVTLQLDIDAGNSVHINKNNNGFNFRPVIYVDRLDAGFAPRLVRLQGVLSDYDANGLLLCRALPVQGSDEPDGCVEVDINDDSAFFDNQTQGGAPRPFSELLDDSMLGKPLTVIGWPDHDVRLARREYDDDDDDDDDDGDDDDDRYDDDGDKHDSSYRHLMEVDALLVELGDFAQFEGEVAVDADASGFSMNVADSGGISIAGPLLVAFQDGGVGYNGTRFVSKSGELLEFGAIVAPLPVKVDGVLEVLSDADDMLKAALVIVDTDAADQDPQITGSVLALTADGFSVNPDADRVCGVETDDFSIDVADDADLLTVVITGAGSVVTPGGSIVVDALVGINGRCTMTGYTASSVVIIDDQR